MTEPKVQTFKLYKLNVYHLPKDVSGKFGYYLSNLSKIQFLLKTIHISQVFFMQQGNHNKLNYSLARRGKRIAFVYTS